MTKQITVGYNGSGPSSEAVMWAADEAAARGARLKILSCYQIRYAGDVVFGWTATEAYASLLAATESGLVEIKGFAVNAHPGLEITTEATAGPPGFDLVHDANPDDLIVVGASGHERGPAFWLGNTAHYVVRHSPCPVVVVRGPVSRGHPDRIVVGVDGSTASEMALRWAGDEADRHGAPLVVVHSWSYPYVANDAGSSQARDLTMVDAATVVDRAVAVARMHCGVDVTRELVEGSPVWALLQAVRDGDLLVLGSRGRGAVVAGLFGSTVNSVLDHCVVPVVVVRGQDDRR